MVVRNSGVLSLVVYVVSKPGHPREDERVARRTAIVIASAMLERALICGPCARVIAGGIPLVAEHGPRIGTAGHIADILCETCEVRR
jgi:hypothetical protein